MNPTRTDRKPGMKAADVMTDVVARLVTQMKAGAGTWSMPWRTTAATGWPSNAATGNRYQAGNVLALWVAAAAHGYTSQRWATYKQWASTGAQVQRGERGTHLIYWHQTTPTTTDTDQTTDTTTNGDTGETRENGDTGDSGDTATRPGPGWARAFTVFNANQVATDETTADDDSTGCVLERDETAETVLAAVPADIRWGRGRPAYDPTGDFITIPAFDAFATADHAYATLLHELAHWTGHPSRLARTFGRRFGDHAYAAEELVAELSAAFTCATVGIDTVARTDHAAYLNHWAEMLTAQPSILWSVAAKAQAATDHLHAYSPTR